MTTTPRRLIAWTVVALLMLPTVGLADGGGGGGGDEVRTTPQDPDYTAAVKAIQGGQFDRAIPLLEGVTKREPSNADAYNWLAYAMRKNGDPARSIPIYQKALSLDPKHLGAHEYIGEAYLALDNLAKAKEHLSRLSRLCLFGCEQYTDLKKAVQAYEKRGGTVKPAGLQR
jgi:tetratricopeptide (TPR) repeat protein